MQDKAEIKKRDDGKVDQNQARLETFLEVHRRGVSATAYAEYLTIAQAPAVPSSLI